MRSDKSGWVTFSWIVLLMIGMVNALYGLAGLGRSDYFPSESLVSDSITAHATIWLVLGAIQIVVSFLIAKRLQVGLFAGLTLAVLGAVIWFFYMLFIPSSGFALVMLYALVIYGLAAHMQEFAAD